MNTITALVLAHHIHSSLERTLQTVQWCTERIIVFDCELCTKEQEFFAQANAATCIAIPLSKSQPDFSKTRNNALLHVQTDWALFLDSDEYLSDELQQEMQNEMKQGVTQSIVCKRHDVFFGRRITHGESGAVRFVRVQRKPFGLWERSVHEIWQPTGATTCLSFPIVHQSHESVSSFLQKIDWYTNIDAVYRVEKGKRWSLLQTLVYPIAKWIQNYVFRFGFLDGKAGFIMAYMMSLYSLIVRVKMYENTRSHS